METRINTRLSLKRCWDMVNRIQLATTPSAVRERCRIAEQWLKKNEVISNEEYNELMRAVSWESVDSYTWELHGR